MHSHCCARFLLVPLMMLACAAPRAAVAQMPGKQTRRNVIVFVADGLRRGSVNATDTPALYRVRTEGTDFRDSHSVFPTFTTSNASAIATGHGLGDTGDYGNFLYPGRALARIGAAATVAPFLENDDILAGMNGLFGGNYLHETTLLAAAHAAGYNVASVGKLGPTAIQQNGSLALAAGDRAVLGGGAIVLDDSTGRPNGVQLTPDVEAAIRAAGLLPQSPTRSNGYPETSQGSNSFTGDAATAGTLLPNTVQQQWFAEVSTQVLLPRFAAEAEAKADARPFLFLFWSRDPDGTQHNQGDSLQRLAPGIDGETSRLGLRNADRCLQQLLDWLNAHPAIKANTDVFVTSDHGFATITRREIDAAGTPTAAPSARLSYQPVAKEVPEPAGTLPLGFLAVDLALGEHMHLYDTAMPTRSGTSAYAELPLSGSEARHPSTGSALLSAGPIHSPDGADAQLIVTANGGADLIYAPTHDRALVRRTLELLAGLDYVGSLFVDDAYCPTAAACPGALPLSAVGMAGSSPVPPPAIVVAFKTFYRRPGDLQSGAVFSDYPLEEGQGMHGSLARDQTWNNMAAIGPDFRRGFVDELPAGNVDIVPTLAKVLGLSLPSSGQLKGRVLMEAISSRQSTSKKPETATAKGVGSTVKTLVSGVAANGLATLLEYEEKDGVRYYNRACLVNALGAPGGSLCCP